MMPGIETVRSWIEIPIVNSLRVKKESRITNLKQDAYAKVHKRLGKVNDHLSSVVDRHRSDGQIGFLQSQ